MKKKNLKDIIPHNNKIIKLKDEEFLELNYECWDVSLPIYGNIIETLLENGFIVSMLEPNKINVYRQLPASPEDIHQNKLFLQEILKEIEKSNK